MKSKLIPNILLLLMTLLLIELMLRAIIYVPKTWFIQRVTYWDADDDNIRWKKRFSKLYAELNTIPINQNEYKTHPVLGWVPEENLSITDHLGQQYTTNSSGFRSLHEYSRRDDKYTVLVVGDSFTYGSKADDSEVWPTLLQQMDTELNVLNLAVAGYGTDQIGLMLGMHIDDYEPDLVIVAFISDNLHRSTLHFRDYWKPYYVRNENSLVLTGIPIPRLSEGIIRVESDLKVFGLVNKSRLLGLTFNSFSKLVNRLLPRSIDEELMLNRIIFEKMVATTQRQGAEVLLLYLPAGKELVVGSGTSKGERFLAEFESSHKVTGLNPRHLFLKKKQKYSNGHYQKAGATVVAEAVHEYVKSLSVYQDRMAQY